CEFRACAKSTQGGSQDATEAAAEAAEEDAAKDARHHQGAQECSGTKIAGQREVQCEFARQQRDRRVSESELGGLTGRSRRLCSADANGSVSPHLSTQGCRPKRDRRCQDLLYGECGWHGVQPACGRRKLAAGAAFAGSR